MEGLAMKILIALLQLLLAWKSPEAQQ